MRGSHAAWWQAISPLLDAALELPAEERPAWLDALRQRDPALAADVDSALRQHEVIARERFLEHAPALTGAPDTRPGIATGAYTLVAPIGEGGMGTVWLAERRDGEIRHRAAVKFLARQVWRERFLRERQLLASLSHSAIVHIIDAGHTAEGWPYLVMEYVDGQPIDVYAATLPLTERVRLFLRVCEAVSHAHQRLVIHRDLKPTNILVDATGQPKLLDFGIAKVMDDQAHATQTMERLMTPQYASPEQLRGLAQGTATDIYSLGAVLYKLLTGRGPHEGQPRGTAAEEIVAPTRVNRALPADADFILRKALREAPDERYRSVDALASDLEALLESRPVAARAGDRWYRVRTFARRRWIPLTAATVAVASLSGGLYVANRQRVIAERRFQQVRTIANQFIALDAELRTVPGTTKARSRIVTESLAYLESLGRDARGDHDLSLDIGNAYFQIGRVQGVPFIPNLGQFTEAEESLRRADEFIDGVLAADARDARALLTSAQIAHDRMALVDNQNRRDDAMAQATRASERLDRLVAVRPLTPDEVNAATQILSNIAVAHQNSNQFDRAVSYSTRAIALSAGVDAARMRRAAAIGNHSVSLRRIGDLDGAVKASREGRELLDQLVVEGTADAFNVTNALWREGLSLGEVDGPSLERPAEALEAFRRALEIVESQARRDPNDYRSRERIAVVSREIGNILARTDPRSALQVYDHALSRLKEVGGNTRAQREYADLLIYSASVARSLGNRADAKARLDEAFQLLRDVEEYPTDAIEPDSESQHALSELAEQHAAGGHLLEALQVNQELLTKMENWKANPSGDLRDATVVSNAWALRERWLREAGQGQAADELTARRRNLWNAWAKARPENGFVQNRLAELPRP